MEEIASTAAAAERARDDATVAAIASDMAGAAATACRSSGRASRTTRRTPPASSCIGRQAGRPTGRDKTSILFSMKNEPGVLYSILEPLRRARAQPDQDRVAADQAAPLGVRHTSWTSRGTARPKTSGTCWPRSRERCQFLKVLGSYPAA